MFSLGEIVALVASSRLKELFQVDGAVDDEIDSDGDFIVGESGIVDARVRGKRVKIFGRVNGDIDCSERLELHSGARVFGNLSCPTLIIQDGVTFEGHCSMDSKGQASAGKNGDASSENRSNN